ncbi:MAG: hypothetical protein FWH27_10575 [Planctomycetaceae bacterium]|nr:hypothetical protein [Planctomycetaceae bacterium]
MKKAAALILGLLCLVGCSDKMQLGGTVTFEEDGASVTVGNVIFATSTYEASGIIGSDGKYVMGSIDVADGLPQGSYKVYISGAAEEVAPGRMRSLIDPKFASFASTPLTCEIPAPNNTFDIKVPKNPSP